MDNSADSIGADTIWNDFGIKGEGTTIAILDTGVDFDHESLDDLDDNPNTDDPKIAVDSDGMFAFYNANTDKEYPDEQPHDSGSHGTHCAGIAAGTGGASGTYAGVAPQANLAGVIALDGGSGDEQDLLRAVDWTIANKDRFSIDVMSLSLGGPVVIPGATNNGGSSISQALDVAVESGIVTVVAIGNGNFGAAAHPGSVTYPGDSEKAITVGSVNDDHNREVYSSRGPTGDGRLKPDVMAPGGAVMSARANSGDDYVSYSGTSMAAPHVAGVAALIIQANPDVAPDLDSDYVKQILRETSDHRIPLDVDCGEFFTPNNCYGWGTTELVGAVSRAQDLDSTILDGPTGIQTQTNETFTSSMRYTKSEYTNRGKDGGTTTNFIGGTDLPDVIKMYVRYSSEWPEPTKFSIDAGATSGVSGEASLKPVSVAGGQWVIEATFNYTGQLDAGSIATSLPVLEFDIQAPSFNEAIPVTVVYTLNDMRATERKLTVASFTDLPDLLIEELVVPDVILEGQEVSVTARVVNQGPGPARQYSVDFSSDGVLFQSVHDSQAMESDSAANAQAKWIAEAGTHVLKASIEGVTPQDEDLSNQEFQVTVVVDDFVDSQPPLVFITEPYQNEIVSDLVVVKGTASDNNIVDHVEVRVVPNAWERANGYQNWIWAWNTSLDLNGRYTLEARSFDGFNFSAVYAVDVEVTNDGTNRRPTANLEANNYDIYSNEKIVFSGNGSSDDSAVVKYHFEFGDGKETDWIPDSWIEYYFEEPGEYEVTLNVEDDAGVRSSSGDMVIITVNDQTDNGRPIAVMASPQTGTEYRNDKPVQLSSQGSTDPDNDELTFTWSSSLDGELYTTPNFFTEVFLSDGLHVITLTAVDSRGASDSISRQITVVLASNSFDEESPLLTSLDSIAILLLITLVSVVTRRRH
ncbi:MAG: S8 family serine peptidase [Candidatus Thermoplasmatota archaeon]|nr:S8 family serine peptidase [Candidatus Thermoplasmatota archaeon]